MTRIGAITSTDALADEFMHLQTLGANVPYFVGVNQDAKESTAMQIQLGQAGLGLPDRDYYTKTDEASQKLRDQYVALVTKMFTLLGDAPDAASAEAQTVMTIETQLAKASKTRVERRDAEANYHRMSLDSLNTLTPALGFARLNASLGITDTHPVNVAQPEFVQEVNTMVTAVPLADWRTYLRWHWARTNAEFLSTDFVNASFDFYGRTLSGQKVMRPRWKRARRWVDQGVGEALGQLYVAKAFPPDAKARALHMVDNLRAELRDRIEHLAWMSDATKAQAIKKLDAFGVKIGYPETWRDYTGLTIDRASLVGDVVKSRTFEFQRNLNKLGKPVDRKEWGMTPPTVNAYYNPRRNEIVFPAGILQPPFFFPDADDAVNYGGMGAVIGHEMTHGFDDQGRKSDAEGNLKDWWAPEDAAKYVTQATLVQKQFDGFVAVDSLHVNGKLTLGEDIADLGGLSIAYGALERALAGKPHTRIDGFTPEQRFFLSFAQIWREKMRPEALKLQVNTDPHAPGRYRVLGPLANMTEFQQAFGLKDGDAMVRPADLRAKIW
jgi:putative endopeptidase